MSLDVAIGALHLLLGATQLSRHAREQRQRQALEGASPYRALGDAETPTPRARVVRVANINERVQRVIRQIQIGREDPVVRQAAVEAVSQRCGDQWCTPEKDHTAEVAAVFGEVRRRVRYCHDIRSADTFQSARRTLEFGGGDCDDFTITLGAMLEAIGFHVAARVVQTVDAEDFNHIYLLCGVPPTQPTRWVPLDASVDRPPGWEAPKKILKRVRDFPVP